MISERNKLIIQKLKERTRSKLTLNDLQNLLDMAKYVLKEDAGELAYCLKISNYIKECLKLLPLAQENLDLYWKTLHFEAPYIFDSYMLYVEKNREPSKRFWQPRKKCIGFLAEEMQGLEDNKYDLLTISMPPGTGKSTLEVFYLSWIMGKHPDEPNLMSAHSGMLTRSIYDGVSQILTDTVEYCWRDVFPDVKIESFNAKEQAINLNRPKRFKSFTGRAIGASLTGATRCERLLCADDLCSGIEEALNIERLDKLWQSYNTDLKTRKKGQCKEMHIQTRWSVHDVVGRLIRANEDNPRAKFINVPALDENGESNFEYDYGVGFTKEYFEDMRNSMDDISFRCLYMGEPIEREGLLYHEDELRRYLTLPITEPDAILGVCDTKNTGTDFMFLPCMLKYGNDYYLTECICDDNTDFGVQYANLAKFIVDNKMQQCEFESNNGGGRVAYEVAQRVEKMNGRCNITDNFTTANKQTKIIVNSDWVKKQIIFRDKSLYKPKEDYGVMMKWLLTYTVTGKPAHDDVPDGLACFALYVTNGIVSKVEVMKRPF